MQDDGSKLSFNSKLFSPAKSSISVTMINMRKSNKINWKNYLDTLMDSKKGSMS